LYHLVDSRVAGRIEISAQLGGCQIRGEVFHRQPSPRSAGDALNGRGRLLSTQREDDERVVRDGCSDAHTVDSGVLFGNDKIECVSGGVSRLCDMLHKGLKVKAGLTVALSKDGNVVGLTSILDPGHFVF